MVLRSLQVTGKGLRVTFLLVAKATERESWVQVKPVLVSKIQLKRFRDVLR